LVERAYDERRQVAIYFRVDDVEGKIPIARGTSVNQTQLRWIGRHDLNRSRLAVRALVRYADLPPPLRISDQPSKNIAIATKRVGRVALTHEKANGELIAGGAADGTKFSVGLAPDIVCRDYNGELALGLLER